MWLLVILIFVHVSVWIISNAEPFLLHSPILEPNLHLSIGQLQSVADFESLLSSDKFGPREFGLQLGDLVLCVGSALLSSRT